MTAENWNAALAVTLDFEGGNDDDVHDPGGRTSRGITQREYDVWRRTHAGLPADVWRAPQATIVAIYFQKYWVPVAGDLWPKGLDLVVFDAGVNSGEGKALAWSEYTLNHNDTLPHLAVLSQSVKDKVALVHRFCARRLSFLHALRTWAYFGRGWASRVSKIEAIATKWTLQAAGAPDSAVQAKIQQEAAISSKKAAASGGTATAAPAAPGAAIWNLDHASLADYAILAGIVLLALVAVAYLAHYWYVHSSRSAAFSQVATQ